eukprot:2229490-Amphidinium_carterae.1
MAFLCAWKCLCYYWHMSGKTRKGLCVARHMFVLDAEESYLDTAQICPRLRLKFSKWQHVVET